MTVSNLEKDFDEIIIKVSWVHFHAWLWVAKRKNENSWFPVVTFRHLETLTIGRGFRRNLIEDVEAP